MKFGLKAFSFILICGILLNSCALTKEQRRLKRASRKLEKLTDKYPELIKKDTVWANVEYTKPKTTLTVKVDRNAPDSLVWRNGDATLIRVVRQDSVFYTVICDTVTIKEKINVPVDRIQPVKYVEKELSWWQRGLMWAGGIALIIVVLLIFRNLLYIRMNRF